MTSTELKKFVVDGNATGHERRLAILRTFTWNLPNPKHSKKLCKRASSLMQYVTTNFEKQVCMCEAYEQDVEEYDQETKRMDELIAQKKAELEALQIKWKEINIEKINQEKREALAQIITSLPSREESQQVLDEISQQQHELMDKEKQLNNKVEARRELLFPLGINLAMIMGEFKDDIESRQKKIQESKSSQKESKMEVDGENEAAS